MYTNVILRHVHHINNCVKFITKILCLALSSFIFIVPVLGMVHYNIIILLILIML